MRLKKFFNGKGFKIILISLVVLFITLFSLSIVFVNLEHDLADEKLRNLSNAYNSIYDELEFNGLGSAAQDKITEYSKLFGQKVNVIIADENGNVVYKLNSAFMPDNGQFLTVFRKDNRYVNVLNRQKDIKYVAELDYSFLNSEDFHNNSINKIRAGHSYQKEINVSNVESSSIENESSDRENPSLYMTASYISSKGYFLYSVAANNSFEFGWNNKTIQQYNHLAATFGPLSGVVLILFWLLLPVWIYIDAQKRGFRAALWTVLTLFTNVIGLLVYFVVRPEYDKCKNCNKQLDSRFITCPYCGTQNKELCPSCKQVIEPQWVACPYCGNSVDPLMDDRKEEITE